MSKTNIGLVSHAESALKEKWFYGWGSYGQKATAALVDQLIRQYPSNNMWKSYMLKAVISATRLCDCYGLVKSYLWWMDDNSNPKYNSAQDRNTLGAYNAGMEKGPLSTLPEIPGVILWMNGHVGVYCGNGRFIELMGGGVGAFEGRVANGRITKGSQFTHWFKDINISYIEEKKEMVSEVVETIKIKINDRVGTISSILINGINFIKLNDLTYHGFKIGYDENSKMPELNSPVKSDKTDIIIDGSKYTVNRILINGKNYVELQSLIQSGFTVGYNPTAKIPELITPNMRNTDSV